MASWYQYELHVNNPKIQERLCLMKTKIQGLVEHFIIARAHVLIVT